jgi:hypothetical protein
MLSLENISRNELELYERVATYRSSKGTIDEITLRLREAGIFDSYREIHEEYYTLCNTTIDQVTQIEALKRLAFLNWYSILEPGFLTGVEDLDQATIFKSYTILDEYIKEKRIDDELKWMLSYYSSWDYIILLFCENKLDSLTAFVKNVDTSILHFPKYKLPKGTMDNRGQMGLYWASHTICL